MQPTRTLLNEITNDAVEHAEITFHETGGNMKDAIAAALTSMHVMGELRRATLRANTYLKRTERAEIERDEASIAANETIGVLQLIEREARDANANGDVILPSHVWDAVRAMLRARGFAA